MSNQNRWLEPALVPEIARWLSRMLGLQWCEWAHLSWPCHCFGPFSGWKHMSHPESPCQAPASRLWLTDGRGHSAHWEPGGHHHLHLTQRWPVVMDRGITVKPHAPCIKTLASHLYKQMYFNWGKISTLSSDFFSFVLLFLMPSYSLIWLVWFISLYKSGSGSNSGWILNHIFILMN